MTGLHKHHCGNEFHRFTTLRLNRFLLFSILKVPPLILRLCPLVLDSPTTGNILSISTLSRPKMEPIARESIEHNSEWIECGMRRIGIHVIEACMGRLANQIEMVRAGGGQLEGGQMIHVKHWVTLHPLLSSDVMLQMFVTTTGTWHLWIILIILENNRV